MRQKTVLRRLQRLDRNGWHEISVEAQSVCQAASLARHRRWRESWQTVLLVEDSPARRRLLTVGHRYAPVSRRSCGGHGGRRFAPSSNESKAWLLTPALMINGGAYAKLSSIKCWGVTCSPRRIRPLSDFLRRLFLALSNLRFRKLRSTNKIGNQL
jgi:hypothetical protein